MTRTLPTLRLRRLAVGGPLAALLLALAPGAHALSIADVDLDPATTGVQSFRPVALGQTLSVDVLLAGVNSSQPIDAFAFDLGFDPAKVNVTGVSEGDFFASASDTETDLNAPEVDIARDSTSGSASGGGILVTLELTTVALGDTHLDLNDVALTGNSEMVIENDALLRVVPEPGTAALLLGGCAALGAAGRRRWRAS